MLLALAATSAEYTLPTLRWKKPVEEKGLFHITDLNLQGAGGGSASSGDSDSGDKKGCFAGSETLLFESGASLLQFDSRLCPSVDQIVTRVAQSGLHPLGSALLAFARVVQEQAVNLWRLTSSGPSYWFCSTVCGLIGGRAAVAAAG